METVIDLLLHPFLDSLKTLPFLFIAYLLIEYVEHRASSRFLSTLTRLQKTGHVIGAVLGIVPQCGFLVSSIRLYGGGLISIGTLVAIFIATSDEALPVLLSSPIHYKDALLLILIKVVLAILIGYMFDFFVKRKNSAQPAGTGHSHESVHDHCEDDCCEHGILQPTIKHTLRSWLFIFLSLFVFEAIVHFVGEDAIASVFMEGSLLQPVIATLVGLIPGCAPSIILSQLYISGALSFASLTAGLIVNSGIGFVFLFRTNKNLKQNILMIAFLFILAIITGFIIQLI